MSNNAVKIMDEFVKLVSWTYSFVILAVFRMMHVVFL